jgi:3-oxoacyl-[acyl-carrier protein] reductase
MRLAGRVAVITGAGRGIGAAIAEAYAREGARLTLAARTPEQLQQSQSRCQALGAEVLAVPTDVRVPQEARKLVGSALERFGKIDILVNNAGVSRHRHILDISEEDWDITFDVNVKGVFLCTQAVLPHMMQRRAGRIINVASMAAFRGSPRKSAYAASKHAVLGFADSIAQEVGPYGISVNTICPGPVATEMRSANYPYELPELLVQPEEVAHLAVFLASDEARTIHGAAIRVAVGPEPIQTDERQPEGEH